MILYGASGHAKVIIDILEAMGEKVDCLIDDYSKVSSLQGYPVYNSLSDSAPASFIVSIGDNLTRRKIVERLSESRESCISFTTAVHPSAIVSPKADIGAGSVVMQGAVIQTEAKIGKHCIVNTASSIDHECFLGDFVHVSPHATLCGNVHVGEGSWIGAGAVVVPGVRIGRWAVVGAGSVITSDVPDFALVFGNRGPVIKENYYKDMIINNIGISGGGRRHSLILSLAWLGIIPCRSQHSSVCNSTFKSGEAA